VIYIGKWHTGSLLLLDIEVEPFCRE
jgi:hypothetical protein